MIYPNFQQFLVDSFWEYAPYQYICVSFRYATSGKLWKEVEGLKQDGYLTGGNAERMDLDQISNIMEKI